MSNELKLAHEDIAPIFEEIKILINDSRNKVYNVVNTEMLNLYWNIGRIIMEIQQGDERATYGDAVLEKLSIKLTKEFGKDLVKDPFVLEFLDVKENTEYMETDLEKNILKHLKDFLLELGKGFSYVGNQVRLTLEEDHFYPDLFFYNRLVNCFVIIDLKIGKVTHQDIGQMQMYVNYYDREIKKPDERPTVGILLCTDKNKTVVKYTLPENNESIFASEYKLHLPTENELVEAIENEKKNLLLNSLD